MHLVVHANSYKTFFGNFSLIITLANIMMSCLLYVNLLCYTAAAAGDSESSK